MNESVRRDRIVLPPKTKPRVLISTIEPGVGGVGTMTQFIVDEVQSRGFEPVIAFYAPYRRFPQLSRPSFKWFSAGVDYVQQPAFGVSHCYGIGAALPEFEFTHYGTTPIWQSLIEQCDAFVSVSGNLLAATAMVGENRPVVAWVATDWAGDRVDRVKSFSWPRRLLDALIVRPRALDLEQRLLAHSKVLALSEHTSTVLARFNTSPKSTSRQYDRLPMPVDCEHFRPDPARRVRGRIGFVGRFDDPRKNIALFIETIAALKKAGKDVHGVLVGGEATEAIHLLIAHHGAGDAIKLDRKRDRDELPAVLQTLDIFFLPSHQEGLCIAALEAMACGVPVVSTRCGGPEEFVIPGKTGALVDFSATSAAAEISTLLAEINLRDRIGEQARRFVEDNYSIKVARESFWRAFDSTFPALSIGKSA
jgi:glycosyltransferase involved in cell wall biosynthesis